MAFHITRRDGAMERPADTVVFANLLAELDVRPEDTEHTSVAVTHESEWCLSVSAGGYVVWENLEDGDPSHMRNVPRERILQLWRELAAGDIDKVASNPWQPGY